jgi:hypothetical protein
MEKTLYEYQPGGPEEPEVVPAARSRTITSIFFILFCVEIGLVLFLLPWTLLWDNNYFFSLTPQWNAFWLSTYLRGAVSGIGVINLWIGLAEAWRLWH